MTLSRGDRVIFSSRPIPGNEKAIGRVINGLIDQGVEVITDRTHLVHVSGHPRRAELEDMIGWVRPQHRHSGARRGAASVRARRAGARARRPHAACAATAIWCGSRRATREIIDEVPAGRIYKDGALLIEAEARTVADRKRLSFAGIVSVALALNDKGELLADPEVELIGIPDNDRRRRADGRRRLRRRGRDRSSTLPKPRRRDPDAVAEAVRRGVRAGGRRSTGARSRTSPCTSWSCEGVRMADLKMTLACWNYDRTRALMDGSVKPEGIDLTYHNSFPAATFHRMMGKREFEASELGLTFYLDTLHEDDPPFVAIPVYPIRLFSHSAIYINTNKGIREPKDLVGKKIGEFFLYGHDAGTWSKGILQDHYGVPIDSYSNYIGGVERPTPPLALVQAEAAAAHPGAAHRHRDDARRDARRGRDRRAVLGAGAAVDGARLKEHRAAVSRFREGRARLLQDHRHLSDPARRRDPQGRLQGQSLGREVALQGLQGSPATRPMRLYRHQSENMHRMFMVPWITQHFLEMQALLGDDWFSYGLKRNYKPLDTFLRYHYEQGLSKRRFKPEDLFLPETLDD